MKPSLPAATLRRVSKNSPWLSAQEVIPNAYPLRALPNTVAYRWRQYLPDVEAYSPCATRKVHSQGFQPLGLYPGHHCVYRLHHAMECPDLDIHVVANSSNYRGQIGRASCRERVECVGDAGGAE